MVHNPTGRISVVIAEKVRLYREGLRLLAERSGLHVVGTAADVVQALTLVREFAPQVLVLDLSIPGIDIDRTLRALASLPKPPRTLLLADEASLGRATQAILQGAHGVFSKEGDGALLLKSIYCLSHGQYWISRTGTADVVGVATRAMARHAEPGRPARFGLTRRKLEIIAAIADGQSNREIAAALGLSEQTIKHHLSSIFEKTGVSTRLELALFSLANQLVKNEPSLSGAASPTAPKS